jgi:ubiquinone/menaquinone biosynthesis C-methylase UbiE
MAHSHTHTSAQHTEGRLIHWATAYDLLVQVITLGQSRKFRQHIADVIPVQRGDAVLDVGCGTGDLAFVLAQRVGATGTVIGIDASPEMIARAQRKARRRGSPADFQVALAQALPFADQRFDHVVSSLAFHHLPGDLKRQALLSVARVLKSGGRVTIIDFFVPAGQHAPMSNDTALLLDWLPEAGFEDIHTGPVDVSMMGAHLFIRHMQPLSFVQARRKAAE